MRRPALTFFVAILALSLAGAAVAGQFGKHGGGPGAGFNPMRAGKDFGPGAGLYRLIQDPDAAKAAGISSDQIAALKELLPKHREEMKALAGKARDARDNFRELMESGKADEASLRVAAKDLTDARADRLDLVVTHHVEIAKILTAEQMAKVREMAPPRGRAAGRGPGPNSGPDDDPLFA
ncbi:MAG: Spy/CpxP family protein refolding chaperone [Deltaproteobacteria bacterium]|nr:Spy/CpxP family protein refolding chaperone [Deltaproteobacteria bacterium]